MGFTLEYLRSRGGPPLRPCGICKEVTNCYEEFKIKDKICYICGECLSNAYEKAKAKRGD